MTIRIILSVGAAAFLSCAQPTHATPLYDMTPMLNQWQPSMGNSFQPEPSKPVLTTPRFAPPPIPTEQIANSTPPSTPLIQPSAPAAPEGVPEVGEQSAFHAPVQIAAAPNQRQNKQSAYVAFGAGASILQDASLSLTGDYRFFATLDPTFSTVDAEFHSHNFTLGVMQGF
jgi:hypothetical protein